MTTLPRMQSQFIALSGGLDLSTPPIVKANSEAISAVNVQPLYGGGFGRIEGYEPIDGKMIPHKMKYVILHLRTPLENLQEIDRTFQHKTKTYTIIEKFEQALVVAYFDQLGLVNGDSISFSHQNVIIEFITPQALNFFDHQRYGIEAVQIGMRQVEAISGKNPLRGVVELNNELIVFRDEGEKCGVFYSHSQGWQAAPTTYLVTLSQVLKPENLIRNLAFQAGQLEGIIYSAILSPDLQRGYLVLSQAVNKGQRLSVNNTEAAVVEKCEPVTLSKGKPWQFVYHNFYGGAESFYAYGCNGEQVIEVRPDGVIVPILVNNDSPRMICVHRNHLFAAFPGGQLGHSLVGRPEQWSILLGAEQIGLGSEITALSSHVGGVLLIGCENKTAGLYGSSREDWVLKEISPIGIYPNTLQSAFAPIAVSKNGIIRIDQTEQFGDFRSSEVDANRKLKVTTQFDAINFSSTVPKSNQIRYYDAKGRHICMMLLPNGNTIGTFFTYPDKIQGVWQSPNFTYLAFNDGKVYRQDDNCRSFGFNPINWLIKMAFSHCGTPSIIKSWHNAELQASTEGISTLRYRYDLDYNSTDQDSALNKEIDIAGGGGRWNDSFWNDFLWSAEDYSTPVLRLAGYSRNLSLSFSGSSLFDPPFELSGLVINYISRRNYRV